MATTASSITSSQDMSKAGRKGSGWLSHRLCPVGSRIKCFPLSLPTLPEDSSYISLSFQTNLVHHLGLFAWTKLTGRDWEGWLLDGQPIMFATWASQTHLVRNLSQETQPGFAVSTHAAGEWTTGSWVEAMARQAVYKARLGQEKTLRRGWGSHLVGKGERSICAEVGGAASRARNRPSTA